MKSDNHLWRTLAILLILSLLTWGCAASEQGFQTGPGTETSSPTVTTTDTPTSILPTYPGPGPIDEAATPYPGAETPVFPSPGAPYPYPGSQATITVEPTGASSYPGPDTTIISPPTARPSPGGTAAPTPTRTVDPLATPVEPPVGTAEPPPQPAPKTVSIWHSWNETEQQVLDYTLRSFQTVYPDTYFMVTYYPEEQLKAKYIEAAYRNEGPSLLFGPAEWGPELYDLELVVDVAPIAEENFLATINPAALEEARYHGALIGLPHAIREGVVMFRNKSIILDPPATFDELVAASKNVTGIGEVGAYLETSFFFAGAHLPGIGGEFIDENGLPVFNNDTGVAWLGLLNAFNQVGITGYNTDRDVELFKAGKIGIIIESTLRQGELAEAIGAENLAINPWPDYGSGSLAGFIKTDNIYVNARTAGDERYSSLLVMGFFLAREVQAILSTAGHIPVVSEISVEDAWMQEAVEAFQDAMPYPIHPAFQVYTQPLDNAISTYFNQNAAPASVLTGAEQVILSQLEAEGQ
ncbi:MAG: extracellular solute-binding protein [Chloroflexi bacterium]|nr:MAG: extracellular solute-binding protein [Chloroflexota bacterium]